MGCGEAKPKAALLRIVKAPDQSVFLDRSGKASGRGAYIFDGENGIIKAPYDMPVVDTTAAGDAFTAALTLEYLKSGDIMSACDYANAAGSITVSRAGASSSIPNEKEIADFISSR